MSFGVPKSSTPSAKRARAYSAVWSKPGMVAGSNTRNDWGLAAVLQLGHLRRRPRQRLCELPAGDSGRRAQLAEPLAKGAARLVDVRRVCQMIRVQNHPVALPYARQHRAN